MDVVVELGQEVGVAGDDSEVGGPQVGKGGAALIWVPSALVKVQERVPSVAMDQMADSTKVGLGAVWALAPARGMEPLAVPATKAR